MGLDQYLYARREFPVGSPQADQILAAAGISEKELHSLAVDPAIQYDSEREVYLGRWEHMRDRQRDEYDRVTRIHEAAGTLPFATSEAGSGSLRWDDGKIAVSIACCYWRKANSVHGWFVDNVQGGIDECQESPVHPEHLALLRSSCEQGLIAYERGDKEGAAMFLQPRSGFFFGNTEINEWWAEDMKNTIQQLDHVLKLAANTGGVSFSYRASW